MSKFAESCIYNHWNFELNIQGKKRGYFLLRWFPIVFIDCWCLFVYCRVRMENIKMSRRMKRTKEDDDNDKSSEEEGK